MWKIIDRLLLALCCIAAMLAGEVNTACIVGMLAAIIMNCIILYFDERAVWVRTALVVVYAVFCVLFPEFLWMLPVFAYELFSQKKRAWPFLCLLPFFLNLRMEGGIFWKVPLAYMFLQFLSAWLLAEKTRALEKRKKDYQQMQDAYSELKEKAERQQRELASRQDAEIYTATLAERNRIAREIHDNVGHMLSRSILQVGALKAVNGQDGLVSQLEALQSTLNAAMDNIRESVHDLKDEAFDLEADLQKLAKEYGQFHIQLDYDMSSQTPRALKYCFAAIVREGLTNIAKHSNATKVRIVVREHPALYQLLMEDNGSGHGQSSDGGRGSGHGQGSDEGRGSGHGRGSNGSGHGQGSRESGHGQGSNDDGRGSEYRQGGSNGGSRGIGLENMKERVDAFGGSFYVSQEKGFRIFLSIPKESQ